MSSSRTEPDVPREGAGPSVMVLPLLVLVCWVLWARSDPSGPRGERAAPPPAAEQQTQGWLGGLDLEEGAGLEARLVSLHGEERRQDFDRAVLAARLGLGSGEPWLLELAYSSGAGGGAPSLSLEALGLISEAGPLVPLVSEAPVPAEGGVIDPLLSLLALPLELPPDSRLTAVLWGERPSQASTLTLGVHRIPMAPGALPAGSIPRTLAHVERAPQR